MAISSTPDPVLCVDVYRHRGQSSYPAATTLVRYPGKPHLTGRCEQCYRSLAALSPEAVVVDAYELGPARIGGTTTDHDHDTAV